MPMIIPYQNILRWRWNQNKPYSYVKLLSGAQDAILHCSPSEPSANNVERMVRNRSRKWTGSLMRRIDLFKDSLATVIRKTHQLFLRSVFSTLWVFFCSNFHGHQKLFVTINTRITKNIKLSWSYFKKRLSFSIHLLIPRVAVIKSYTCYTENTDIDF